MLTAQRNSHLNYMMHTMQYFFRVPLWALMVPMIVILVVVVFMVMVVRLALCNGDRWSEQIYDALDEISRTKYNTKRNKNS